MEENNEDIILLSNMKQGNEQAFNNLFRKYYPILCAYGHKFVDLEDAEECAQETMLWLWNNREALIIQTSLSSYLFTSIHNRALNILNKKENKNFAENYFYQEMQTLTTEIDFYQLKELNQHIQQAITSLPPSYKEAFIMHRFKNMSYKEIAEQLNVSPKTIDYRIQQALKILRAELKDYLPLAWFMFLLR